MVSSVLEAAGASSPRIVVAPRTLLLEMPFKSLIQPSIGLSLLKAVLVSHGFECDLRYANAEFARVLGPDAYRTLGELLPHEYLAGDLVFAPLVHDGDPGCLPLEERAAAGANRRQLALSNIPDWFWRRLPHYQEQARRFVAALADEIAAGPYQVIGLNVTFQTMPSLALARCLKERAPDLPIILGGAHCEGEMGHALHESYPWIDFVCRGEGEALLPALLAHLSGDGPPLDAIPGLIWRRAGASVCNGGNTERVIDLDAAPAPRYDDWLEQLNRLGLPVERNDLWMPLETSRGCWFGQKQHCIFCGLNGENLAFRRKSPERVLEELRGLLRYDIPHVFAVDLIFPHQFFTTLLPRLAAEGFGFTTFFEIKANLTREQLALLAAAGVTLLQPGIESLSTPILKRMRKGVSAYQNVRLLKWAVEYGINLEWNLLYAIPGEDPDEYRKMAALIPLLTHLRPATAGCCRVRIDRFSPLFTEQEAFGITGLRPALAYEVVYGLPDATLRRLAYHFDSDQDDDPEYVAPVREAMRRWHEVAGESSLTMLEQTDSLWLFDRRPAAIERQATLSGLERAIYLACDAGETPENLARATGASEAQLWRVLERLVANGWVVELDGRYLSLAVRVTEPVAEAVPEALLGSICHALHRLRMRKMWRPVVRSLRLPETEPAGAARPY